jgi:hypothetical protein
LHNSPNTKRRKIDGPSNGSSQSWNVKSCVWMDE